MTSFLECFWIRGYSNGPVIISSIAVITDEPAGMIDCWDKFQIATSIEIRSPITLTFCCGCFVVVICSYVVQKRLHMFLCKKINIFKGCEIEHFPKVVVRECGAFFS